MDIIGKIRELLGTRRRLDEISRRLEQNSKAVSAADERNQQEHKIQNERLGDILAEYKQSERNRTADARDDNRYQRRLLFVQWMTFFAIVVYAALVYLQWREMISATDAANRGADYSRKQTAITQAGLEGTQAALVIFNDNSPATEPYPITESTVNINISLKNEHPIQANDVKIRGQIRVIRISDGTQVGKIWPCNHDIGVLPQNTPADNNVIYRQCFVEGIRRDDLAAIFNRTETLAFDGFYSYNDGFGTIRTQTICYRYVHPINGNSQESKMTECDAFPVAMKNLRKNLANRTN